jgi:hypothetical protein
MMQLSRGGLGKGGFMEYPRYVSHKEVSAARIASVDPGADGSLILHLEGGFDNVILSHHERMNKPAPSPGWYLVQYDGGHVSFSPRLVFEAGYSLKATASEAAGDDLGPEQGRGEQLSAGNADSGPALGKPVDDEDEDEDEEETANAQQEHAVAD